MSRTRCCTTALTATMIATTISTSGFAQRPHATPTEMAVTEARLPTLATYVGQAATEIINEAGEHYTAPRFVGFSEPISSGCGKVPTNNAAACRTDGTVYYDRQYMSAIMFAAARALHSDGDMAAGETVAHEWGHMMQYMLTLDYSKAMTRTETDADCLAGVIIARMGRMKHLQPGDVEEARWAAREVGDAPLDMGVWGKTIENMTIKAGAGAIPVLTNALGDHGNPTERSNAFDRGYTGSLRSCTAGIPRAGEATHATTIHWWVGDLANAYDRAVVENKPIVVVFGDPNAVFFQRLKKETLETPQVNALADYAVFAYGDTARDIVARNFSRALAIDKMPSISLLAPNGRMLDEEARIVGFFDAPTVVAQLTKHMIAHGWMGPARAPWLPPLKPN